MSKDDAGCFEKQRKAFGETGAADALAQGDPQRCPVWQFHLVYSDAPTREWAPTGCTTAGIGCLECKQPVTEAMQREQAPWRERAAVGLNC